MSQQRLKHGKAVLVIGSGYGALKTANNLALSGIPVVWSTQADYFLEYEDDGFPLYRRQNQTGCAD